MPAPSSELQSAEPEQTEKPKRVSLRPLGRIKPYLLRHKGMLAAALLALVVAAGATLALPLALRRMIDLGFSGIEPARQLLGLWPTLVRRDLVEPEVKVSLCETAA